MRFHISRVGFAMLCVAVALTGCAGYKIQENGQGCGYDVYAPEPYLQATTKVTKGSEGGSQVSYEFTLIWLPNYSKRYRVSSWAGLGKADFSFAFDQGWKLTKIEDKSDNTAVLEAITTLAKGVLPDLTPKALGPDGGDPKVVDVPPTLYRIDFDASGRPACLRRLSVEVLPCPPLTAPVATPCGAPR